MPTPEQILKQYWGFKEFRPMQKEIIESVLQGKDTLALLPTGGGKSLCYQLPALMNDGFCLVISPLIALMQDQVARLKERDIYAAAIYAGMHYYDVRRTLENMQYGPYKLLYISPERLQTSQFLDYLSSFNISMVAVDEAHCVSQWGHDFRPDYLKISVLKELFPNVPILALTASATPQVAADISTYLHLQQPAIFTQSFERKNIIYEVSYSQQKNTAIVETLQHHSGSSIVYCCSRKQTEVLSRYLQQNNIRAHHYHAGLSADTRKDIQQQWTRNEIEVIVATTAFGMGIDKADVRAVIHYDLPEDPESFYQESGRAGRDGKEALSLLLYNKQDITKLRSTIELRFPREEYLRQVYQSVAEYLQIPIGTEPNRYYNFDLSAFCKNFNLQSTAAHHALKLLEQEGLWTLSDSIAKKASIFIKASRQEVQDISLSYPELDYVLTGVLRMYGTLFQGETAISVKDIAKRLKLQENEVERALLALEEMDILEYKKPLTGSQIYIHHYRVDSRHLILDIQRINTLRKHYTERVEAMIDYVQNDSQCRTNQLLAYFKEQSPASCGHCDVCLRKQSTPRFDDKILSLLKDKQKTPVNAVLSHFAPAQRETVLNAIRALADKEQVVLAPDGTITII
jgi:ATP-dependent DNA helicase RecQ